MITKIKIKELRSKIANSKLLKLSFILLLIPMLLFIDIFVENLFSTLLVFGIKGIVVGLGIGFLNKKLIKKILNNEKFLYVFFITWMFIFLFSFSLLILERTHRGWLFDIAAIGFILSVFLYFQYLYMMFESLLKTIITKRYYIQAIYGIIKHFNKKYKLMSTGYNITKLVRR
ncbi:hypothetical protein ACFPDQ_04185 [Pseudofrancisella aestuarii]|uniref:Uncharacterized protein n=1 Tax=Pseudofrancisella aestuarii TaxID=2670347 RepID=A0ABV9TCE8_9GAMM|nr:hypothetical protein [Pseudofrancisella aestuarii]